MPYIANLKINLPSELLMAYWTPPWFMMAPSTHNLPKKKQERRNIMNPLCFILYLYCSDLVSFVGVISYLSTNITN